MRLRNDPSAHGRAPDGAASRTLPGARSSCSATPGAGRERSSGDPLLWLAAALACLLAWGGSRLEILQFDDSPERTWGIALSTAEIARPPPRPRLANPGRRPGGRGGLVRRTPRELPGDPGPVPGRNDGSCRRGLGRVGAPARLVLVFSMHMPPSARRLGRMGGSAACWSWRYSPAGWRLPPRGSAASPDWGSLSRSWSSVGWRSAGRPRPSGLRRSPCHRRRRLWPRSAAASPPRSGITALTTTGRAATRTVD